MLFISPLKLFSFSRYLIFCHDLLAMSKKRLDYKGKVNFKIHDVTTLLTNNCNTHLFNISRNKVNQTMKLGQLTEYNKNITRKIFLFKSYAENETGRLVPDFFLFF